MIEKYLILFIVILILISTTEWFIHKYIMHGTNLEKFGSFISDSGEEHIQHHTITRRDMTINQNNIGPAENLCLKWKSMLIIFIFLLISSLLIGKSIGVKPLIPSVMVIVLSFYVISMWNTIHPNLHHESGCKMGCLFAAKDGTFYHNILVNSRLGIFLKEYHILHHNIKKPKTNFNVTLPIADYLFGTHSSQS